MTEPTQLRIELPLVLPGVDDARDRCVARLLALLTGRPGIAEAHIVGPEGRTPELCIHYDPATITLSRVRELAQASGAELSERYAHVVLRAGAAMQPRAASRIAQSLRSAPGVLEAEVAASGVIRIEYDRSTTSEQALRNAAAGLGMGPEQAAPAAGPAPAGNDAHAGHGHGGSGPFGEKSELIFAILAGVLLVAGWLAAWREAGPRWLPTALYIAAYGFGGWFTALEAFENLRERRFAIDTLTLVAAIGAAALCKWGEGALLLFLFAIGHSLEQYAMGRARRAIEALAELAPDTATVRRGGRFTRRSAGSGCTLATAAAAGLGGTGAAAGAGAMAGAVAAPGVAPGVVVGAASGARSTTRALEMSCPWPSGRTIRHWPLAACWAVAQPAASAAAGLTSSSFSASRNTVFL